MKATLTAIPYSQQNQADPSPTKHIEESTLSYLHTCFLLWEYKNSYNAREYRQLLDDYGWDKGSSEEKRALRIANYELETGCFQIFIEYENKPVSVSKSSVISWLKEQERLNCVTG
jgi:hypothetical protein